MSTTTVAPCKRASLHPRGNGWAAVLVEQDDNLTHLDRGSITFALLAAYGHTGKQTPVLIEEWTYHPETDFKGEYYTWEPAETVTPAKPIEIVSASVDLYPSGLFHLWKLTLSYSDGSVHETRCFNSAFLARVRAAELHRIIYEEDWEPPMYGSGWRWSLKAVQDSLIASAERLGELSAEMTMTQRQAVDAMEAAQLAACASWLDLAKGGPGLSLQAEAAVIRWQELEETAKSARADFAEAQAALRLRILKHRGIL